MIRLPSPITEKMAQAASSTCFVFSLLASVSFTKLDDDQQDDEVSSVKFLQQVIFT